METIKKILRIITFGQIDHVYSYYLRQRTKKRVRKMLATNGNIQLEIGAGANRRTDGWITLDINKVCDLYWDLMKGIPFPDNTISKVYSSHVFEHFTFKEAKSLMAECKRVLKKGGVFSICVPNARIFIDAYSNKDETFLQRMPWIYQPANNNTTRIDSINYMAYLDGHHKYMFDEENLVHILGANGFKNVRLREFDPLLDKADRKHESIYAEGEKD